MKPTGESDDRPRQTARNLTQPQPNPSASESDSVAVRVSRLISFNCRVSGSGQGRVSSCRHHAVEVVQHPASHRDKPRAVCVSQL